MTWETFCTVTGIAYTTYFTLNIAYDVFVYYRHKKRETSTIVSSLFEQGIKPTVVNRELYEPKVVAEITTMPSMQIDKYQQELEPEPMRIEAFLKGVNRVNSSIVSDIYP
jgi:hypothetical protein